MLAKLLSTMFTVSALVKLYAPDEFLRRAASMDEAVSSSAGLSALAQLNGGLTLAAASSLCTVRDAKTALSITAGWLVVAATHFYEVLYGGYDAPFPPVALVAPGAVTLLMVAMLARAPKPHATPKGAFAAIGKLLATAFFAASVWMYRDPAGFLEAAFGPGHAAATQAGRYHAAHCAAFWMFLSAAVCTTKDVKSALSLGSGIVLGVTGPFLYAVYVTGARASAPFPAVVAAGGLTALVALMCVTAPPSSNEKKKKKKTK